MPNHADIYANQADMYERLVSKQASLYETIQAILPVEGLDIIDMGAGAGRFTRVLAPQAKSIVALDDPNLCCELPQIIWARLIRTIGEHKSRTTGIYLPLDHSADLIVSGWSICYLGNRMTINWKPIFTKIWGKSEEFCVQAVRSLLLRTSEQAPERPNPPDFLMNYYRLLESEYGFSHTWIRTDYTFESVDGAEMLSRFFFLGMRLPIRLSVSNI